MDEEILDNIVRKTTELHDAVSTLRDSISALYREREIYIKQIKQQNEIIDQRNIEIARIKTELYAYQGE